MKKRKFPIVPVSLLVIMIGGAIAVSFRPLDAQQEPQEREVTGEERKSGDVKDLSKIAKEQAGSKKLARPGGEDESAVGPALLLPEEFDYKPTPNTSATSAHWYRDGSSQKGP